MKKITIIRHAKSSWDNPSLSDFERPLNKRGLRDAPFMSKMLASRGWKPDLLISSPANRAFTTAGYFAAALGLSETQIRQEKRIYEASVMTIGYLIQELDEQLEHVALFGHNPAFTWFVNQFENDEQIDNVPTCGIVEIETIADNANWQTVASGEGKVVKFHYPKEYF